eukprot:1154066-Pelagomonas_calceolata.AAC.1
MSHHSKVCVNKACSPRAFTEGFDDNSSRKTVALPVAMSEWPQRTAPAVADVSALSMLIPALFDRRCFRLVRNFLPRLMSS